MKRFKVGNVFKGRSHVDLINNTIGTRYNATQKCSFDLEDFKSTGVYAWFVFMDNTAHGYEDGWIWKNYLTEDGKIIREMNVSNDKKRLYTKREEVGYRPYRLAFQLDPYGENNRYCCKFVGAFRLKSIISDDMASIEYEKVMDEVVINSIGDGYNEFHLQKEDFTKDVSMYDTKVEQMGFSEPTLVKFKAWKINTAKELLELSGISGGIAVEIREKIYNLLKK